MKIHLHSKEGLYTVEAYGRNSITCSTKHKTFSVSCDDFKSFAGGLWNHQVTKDEMDIFLSVVQPDQYKMQVTQENEILTLATRMEMINALKREFVQDVQEEVIYEDVIAYEELTASQYEDWWREKCDENIKLHDKMRSIAKKVYSQNLDFSDLQFNDGIKFIIQLNHHNDSYRFCWDPYGFVSNGHSDISSIYRSNDWGTVNGGWIKIIEGDVILYAKSGDYGVYDDAVATECAKKLFPNKEVHSFAGRAWDHELDRMFYELPF
tara:strand:- start:2216 stop:3010 length:795 start_codon:yes stop_codon:yes gene_type:complete